MRYFLLLLTFLVFACAPKPDVDCGFIRNNYGQNLRWKRFPIVIYIDTSFDDQHAISIQKAAAKWEAAIGKPVFQIKRVNSAVAQQDNQNILVGLINWSPRDDRKSAVTSLYFNSDEIAEADVVFNFNYNLTTRESREYGIDLEALAAHELGHLLGLAHNPDQYSIMYYSLSNGYQKEIADIDKKNIRCVY